MFKKDIRLLVAKKKLASIVQVEKKGQKVEDLVKNCNYKTDISSTPNRLLSQTLIPTYQLPIFPAPTLVRASGTDSRPVDKKIDHLTGMMKDLAFSVRILQNNARPSIENNEPWTPPIASFNHSQPSVPGLFLQSVWPDGVTKCSYCWAPDHHFKRHYRSFRKI